MVFRGHHFTFMSPANESGSDGGGGAPAATPTPAAAPAEAARPSLDAVLAPIFNDVQKAEAAAVDTPAPAAAAPVAAATPAATPAAAPAAQPLPGAAPAAPAAVAPTFEQQTLAFQQAQMRHWEQQQQMMQTMMQQVAPKQPAQPAGPKRPTPQDIMATFQKPPPVAGEHPQAYAARVDQAALNHLLSGQEKYLEERAAHIAKEQVQAYQQQQQEAQAQAQGERQFYGELAQSAQRAGVDPKSDLGQWMQGVVRDQIVAAATAGQTQGWTDAHYRQAMQQGMAALKARMAPQPPAAGTPNLQVIPGGQPAQPAQPAPQAPISGSSGSAPSLGTPPPSNTQAPAKDINEVLQRVHAAGQGMFGT